MGVVLRVAVELIGGRRLLARTLGVK